MNDVHVRLATAHDFAAIRAFDRSLAEAILLAERNGAPIGYVRLETCGRSRRTSP